MLYRFVFYMYSEGIYDDGQYAKTYKRSCWTLDASKIHLLYTRLGSQVKVKCSVVTSLCSWETSKLV